MKEKVIYVLKRLRNVVEITLLLYLLYAFIITIVGVKYVGDDGSKLYYTLDVFYLNSYYRYKFTAVGKMFPNKPAFIGQPILEIILFILPVIVWIIYEIYIRRDKLIKNYDSYKQKKNNKKIKRLEQKLSQLKSKEQ